MVTIKMFLLSAIEYRDSQCLFIW